MRGCRRNRSKNASRQNPIAALTNLGFQDFLGLAFQGTAQDRPPLAVRVQSQAPSGMERRVGKRVADNVVARFGGSTAGVGSSQLADFCFLRRRRAAGRVGGLGTYRPCKMKKKKIHLSREKVGECLGGKAGRDPTCEAPLLAGPGCTNMWVAFNAARPKRLFAHTMPCRSLWR